MDLSLEFVFSEFVGGALVNVALRLHLGVVRKSVDFVNEDFEFDIRINGVSLSHC
jgi:hypothetical protein